MLKVLLDRVENLGRSTEIFLKEGCGLVPINCPGLITWRTHNWSDLTIAGKQSQPSLLLEFRRFADLLRALSQELPTEPKRKLIEHLEEWEDVIDQGERSGYQSIDEAILGIKTVTIDIAKILTEYNPSTTETAHIFADTNALLANPAIESWQFLEFPKFRLVLTPSVLAELDDHKVNHKNPEVREKALKLINRMKDYLRRGNIHEGVPISGGISLAMIAMEPKMENSLSWFDSANSDDRCLASIIEIMRSKLGSPIFVVTSDINMTNKATFAGIPLLEVPKIV
jgi:hypothetical protein